MAFILLAPVADAEISDDDLLSLVGGATNYRSVFAEVQSTIMNNDREGFAALVHYPFTIYREKEECGNSYVVDTIEDSSKFVEKFDEIVTPAVREIILDQEFDALILNWQGLGFARGVLWITGHCVGGDEDNSCPETVVGVRTVNTHAAQCASE